MFLLLIGVLLVGGVGAVDSGAISSNGFDSSKLANPDRPGHVCVWVEERIGNPDRC